MGRGKRMINKDWLITAIAVFFFIYFSTVYIREEIKQHKIDKILQKRWDEWDKIKGSFDIIVAERG